MSSQPLSHRRARADILVTMFEAHSAARVPKTAPGCIAVIVVVLLLVVPLCESHADSVFSLAPATDVSLGAGSLSLFVVSQIITPQPGTAVPLDEVNRFDSLLIEPFSSCLDTVGTVGAYATLLLPSAMVLFETDNRERPVPYSAMYAEALLLAYGTKDLLKAIVPRYRPYTYVGSTPVGEEDDYFNSFPSGHTTLAFLATTFLSVTFAREYSTSPWRVPIAIGSYALAAGVGATRVLSGSHFMTDVLAGAAIGVLWGWLIPFLHS